VYAIRMGERDFIQWITAEKEKRGWGVNELARRADLSNSYVSNVLNELQGPGPKFYAGMARAFGMPEVELLRMGGELPPAPGDTERLTLREIWQILQGLDEDQLKEVRRFARFVRETPDTD